MLDQQKLDAARLIAPTDDRRVFHRIPINMLAFVRLAEALCPSSLCDSSAAPDEALHMLQAVAAKDVSMTGLFFFSRHTYPDGAELETRLCLEGAEFEVPAVIARRVRVNNQLYGYGISFRQSRISRDFRVALAAHLLRQDAAVPRR